MIPKETEMQMVALIDQARKNGVADEHLAAWLRDVADALSEGTAVASASSRAH